MFKAKKTRKSKLGTKQQFTSKYGKFLSDNRDKQYKFGELNSTYQNDHSITRNNMLSRAIETNNKRNKGNAKWESIRSDTPIIRKKRKGNGLCEDSDDDVNCLIDKTTLRYKITDEILITNTSTMKYDHASMSTNTQAPLVTHISTDILQSPSSTSKTKELHLTENSWTSTSVPLASSTEDVAVLVTMKTGSSTDQALETKSVNYEGKTEPTTESTKKSSNTNALSKNTFSQILTEKTTTTETDSTLSTSSGTAGKGTLGISASSTTTKLLKPLSKLTPSFNSRSTSPDVTTTPVQTDTTISQIEAATQADNETHETASILSTTRQKAPLMSDSGALAFKMIGSVGGLLVALSTVLCLF